MYPNIPLPAKREFLRGIPVKCNDLSLQCRFDGEFEWTGKTWSGLTLLWGTSGVFGEEKSGSGDLDTCLEIFVPQIEV